MGVAVIQEFLLRRNASYERSRDCFSGATESHLIDLVGLRDASEIHNCALHFQQQHQVLDAVFGGDSVENDINLAFLSIH